MTEPGGVVESADGARIAERLAELSSEAERESYFARHRELRRPEVVGALCDEVTRLVRVDLGRAERLLAAVETLGGRLDEAAVRGRILRARGNLLFSRRDYRSALECYEGALERFRQAGDELEAARTLKTGLGTLGHLGLFDRASAWSEEARRTFERLGEGHHLAQLEVNVGLLLSRQDRFSEALTHFEGALRGFRSAGRPLDIATALRNLAVCRQDLDDFSAAAATYREALEYSRRHGLSLVALEVEYNLAYLHYLRGDYVQAIHLFDEARRTCRELGDRHHEALCDLDQAEIYLELNLVGEAFRLAEKALHGFESLGMDYEVAKALAYQGVAARRRDRWREALALLERSREIFSAQGNAVWSAVVDLYRAQVYYECGDPIAALRVAGSALGSFTAARLPTRIAQCEILLGQLALEDGDLESAGRHGRSALSRLEGLGAPALEARAHLLCGEIAEASGGRERALELYHRSHLALERLHGNLQTDELKISFSASREQVYERLVSLLVRDGASSQDDRRAAFTYMEKAKSRALTDLLSFRLRELTASLPESELAAAQLGKLREELNWHYHRLHEEEMKGAGRSSRRLGEIRAAVSRREKELLRRLRDLETSDPELGSLQAASTADLETIREDLPEDAVLLEYFVARGSVLALLLDRERLEIHRLADAAKVEDAHLSLLLQLGKFKMGEEALGAFSERLHGETLRALERLHRELWAPIRDRLRRRHLVIAPHGLLHRVPFHALWDGKSFLIDSHSLSYAPSATVFHLCGRRAARTEGRALVVGVPDERAPHILEEVRAVADLLPQSVLLVGEQVTDERLAAEGKSARIVHLATHGVFRQDNPIFSALQLGSIRLSLFDLYRLRLDAELVVVSGCATGLGVVQGADELVGLTRGLLYSGARSVLATLWDVHDESTTEFMRLFYRRLGETPHIARALRDAQLELRQTRPHPYFWGPFILVGRPRAINPLARLDAPLAT